MSLVISVKGLPWWIRGKESACQYRRPGFNPWIRKIPWRRKWQPTPALLPGKSYGQRNLAGYRLEGLKRVRHNLVTKPQQQFLLKLPTGCSLTEIQGLLSAQLRPACEGPGMAYLTSWSLLASAGLVPSAGCPASPPPCFCSPRKHHASQAGQQEMGSGSRAQESSLLNLGYSA